MDVDANGYDADRKRKHEEKYDSFDKRARQSSSSSSSSRSSSKDMKSSSSSSSRRESSSSKDKDRERDKYRDRDYKDREREKERDRKSSSSSRRDSKREDEAKRREEEKKKEVDPEEEMRKRREAWKKAKELLNLQQQTTASPPQVSADQSIESTKSGDAEMTEATAAGDEPHQPNKRKMMDLNVEEEDDEVVPESKIAEDEVDPLDAFMVGIEKQVKHDVAIVHEKLEKSQKIPDSITEDKKAEEEEEEELSDEESNALKKWKKKNLPQIDHAGVVYEPFNKKFYIEVPEIARMSKEEVAKFREEHGEIHVRGKECPKPVKGFFQCGLHERILKVMEKLNYQKPTPIQCQAIPAIMSGRDVIGIAKTGSGKTLAFLLPMLRHIMDQRPLAGGEGPVGLVMAPTRELAMQIHAECHKFSKAVGLRAVCVYGGSGVREQIADLKRGAEIVVCTPGRMIDVLCANAGRITNLERVTYLVLDEADRMFDMGFEPQIMRIINNIRPDRQTVLFSATFPRSVEQLAKKILTKPIEIVVGGRSVVNTDIDQIIEVIPEDAKWKRLLDILKEWYDRGNILVFVDRQEDCDQVFTDLIKAGYPCLSLHGGKDQQDRDFTIDDFKRKVTPLMVATSIAARGLDVKDLVLVVNYDVPNHMEDYVHRVGRTGRAGNKGTAITFITPEEEKFAPDITRALEASGAPISPELKALADSFEEKRKAGQAVLHGSGYGGKGFKFDESEERKREEARKSWKRAYGIEEEEDSEEETGADEEEEGGEKVKPEGATAPAASAPVKVEVTPLVQVKDNRNLPQEVREAQQRALEIAAGFLKKPDGTLTTEHYAEELEINDYPQQARWRVTHKDALAAITEWTGAAITTRGSFYPPGRGPAPGDRKLYLYIEGPDATTVRDAKTEIKRILEEATVNAIPEKPMYGKYSVV